jgi:hypothetical protein
MMTNAELAMLCLIAERPRHGYEIEGVIQERGMREWTEVGFSSIYYLLKKLEREGLIVGRTGSKNAAGLPAAEVLDSLRTYRDGLVVRQEHVRGQAERQRPLPEHVEALFDYSLAMIQAEWAWVSNQIEKLEKHHD